MASTLNASTTLGLISSADTSGVLQLQTASTTAVTINASQNVGIGTASPDSRLTLSQTSTPADLLTLKGANSVTGALGVHALGNGGVYLQASSTRDIRFRIASTDMATIDTSGNLGLGVTPSAWSGFKAMQISYMGIAASGAGSGDASISWNAYNNGTNWVYGYTGGKAARYKLDEGTHSWFVTNTNGTAGNAITFTQAMTLDASGNLGVGTTSPAYAIDVAAGTLRLGTGSGSGGTLYFSRSGQSDAARVACDSSSNLQFYTGGSERARIDSSGNLLVGVTSGTYHTMYKDHADWALMARNGNANPYGVAIRYSGAAPNGSVNNFLEMYDTSATRAKFLSNGGLANYSANNSNLSDRREKTNFAPAKSYLDVICSIPVQTYNYIDQNLEEDDGLTLGVVAQDVQAVAPELVMESNWGTEEEPKMRLSIYQTDLQYALMKALQELKAEFDAYKASHP